MNIWKKFGFLYGIILGIVFSILNIGIIVLYLSPQVYSVVANVTIPLIFLFTGISGYHSMRKSKDMKQALLSAFLTIFVSLLLGFTLFFVMTFLFMDVERHNPLLLQNFQKSGQQNLDQFIIDYRIHAAFFSIIFALIFTLISGVVGGFIATKVKKAS